MTIYDIENFQSYIKDLGKNEDIYRIINNLLKMDNWEKSPNFLGKGRSGIVLKIGKNRTIKIFIDKIEKCEINNKYVKSCPKFLHETISGMILHNLRIQERCFNFPELIDVYTKKTLEL